MYVLYVQLVPLVVHGTMHWGKKSCILVWRCHQLLPGFLANGHLPRVSRLSANDKAH